MGGRGTVVRSGSRAWTCSGGGLARTMPELENGESELYENSIPLGLVLPFRSLSDRQRRLRRFD